MTIDRGVETRGLRIRLTLQSQDTETHSAMSGNTDVFNRIATLIGDYATEQISVYRDDRRSLQPDLTGYVPLSWENVKAAGFVKPRIGLAVEAPACILPLLRQDTDLDFAIGHRVLEDPAYAAAYRDRGDRECILDNSCHELGTPIELDKLLDAAELIKPDYVVVPDVVNDIDACIQQFHRLYSMRPPFKLAVVLSGNSYNDRTLLLKETRQADMLCIAYDQPRMLWYLEQLPHWRRVHLLGVSEIAELQAWLPFAQHLQLSTDTGKPTKYGLLGKRMRLLSSLRRSGMSSESLLTQTYVSPTALQLIRQNIAELRHHLT